MNSQQKAQLNHILYRAAAALKYRNNSEQLQGAVAFTVENAMWLVENGVQKLYFEGSDDRENVLHGGYLYYNAIEGWPCVYEHVATMWVASGLAYTHSLGALEAHAALQTEEPTEQQKLFVEELYTLMRQYNFRHAIAVAPHGTYMVAVNEEAPHEDSCGVDYCKDEASAWYYKGIVDMCESVE